MLTAACTRTADREGVRQLLFRDSHAMFLYRCSWNVIHEGLKAENQLAQLAQLAERSRNETPK